MRFWNTRNEKQIATNVKVKRETRTRNTKRETRNAKRLTRDTTATNAKVRREMHNSSIVKYAQRETNCNKCQSETRNAKRNAKRETQHAQRETTEFAAQSVGKVKRAERTTRNEKQIATRNNNNHHQTTSSLSWESICSSDYTMRHCSKAEENPCSRHHLEHVKYEIRTNPRILFFQKSFWKSSDL